MLTRTSDWLPISRNCLGFVAAALAAYLIAQQTVGRSRLKDQGSGES